MIGEPDPTAFPLGARITLAALSNDPYPIYARLREHEPVSWLPALGMYYAVRYADSEAILRDAAHYTVGTENSTLYDTFGKHMLTVDGPEQERYKAPFLRSFMPGPIRAAMEARIRAHADRLIDDFAGDGRTELRRSLACRLPVLTMLSLFGIPSEHEPQLRRWYDAFERALANFAWEESVRAQARGHVEEFVTLLQLWIERYRAAPDDCCLLSRLANAPPPERLDDEALRRNLLIIFFGGISTVEALILNSIYALSTHPATFARVREQPALIPAVLEETIRWLGPVQSATRHVVADTEISGVNLRAGDTINCMLAAANRDPDRFADPDRFDIDRTNLRRHLGFAIGPHHCLGANLARLEGRIALERLIERLPGCRMNPANPARPQGYEFRQPKSLELIWD